MPTLKLTLTPPQAADRHAALAHALTAITAETLGKRAEVTAVVIDERPPTAWYIGARRPLRPTALLEIDITASTNTAAQKAAFIAAAFAELQRQLAPGASLEEASYVIIRDVAAGDWGYSGRTQLARRQAAELAAQRQKVPG
jgi:4-oxalocrotonate tautomerase